MTGSTDHLVRTELPPGRPPVTETTRRGLWSDVAAVWTRETLLILRDPFSMVFSLLQPLVFLGLFAPLLSGMSGGEIGTGSTLQWFLPGVVVMISMFGTSMTGANLQYELMTGSFERILASPLARPALMIGRALKEMTPLMVQALVIILVAWPFGFRIHPAQVTLGLIILGVFGTGIGALSYALAVVSRSTEWIFWAVQQTLLFPLLILSGIMLPLEDGPGWMQAAAKVNPLTYLVEAERTLFAGGLDASVAWGGLAALLTCLAGLAVGVRSLRGGVL